MIDKWQSYNSKSGKSHQKISFLIEMLMCKDKFKGSKPF